MKRIESTGQKLHQVGNWISYNSRLMIFLLAVGVGFAWFVGEYTPNVLVAQDSASSTPAEESADTTKKAESSKKEESKSTERSALSSLRDAGWIGLLILILSMVTVFFIIEHAISIRKEKLMPEGVVVDLEQLIATGQIDQAIEYCQHPDSHSLAADVILSGLERYKGSEFGFAEYKTAVEEAGEDHVGRLYRKTEVLNVIGAIAPMLGLAGTVLGMIGAFSTIAISGGNAKPHELAGSIGQALVTTLLGLVVAIPAMVAVSFFRSKIDSLVAEAGKRIERVMSPLGRKR